MGYLSEYIKSKMTLQQLEQERKAMLKRIADIRATQVLVMAADLGKGKLPIGIEYRDLAPFTDQLSYLKDEAPVDLILETPGGSGEIAEDMVKALRSRFERVSVIVPGTAKSAGTLIAMASDEILMEPASSLGPIDAQIFWQGKAFSAGALIEGVNKIKDEVARTGVLNKAYIPMLQSVSPGELEGANNALRFAKVLVTEWLYQYKFKDWHKRRGTGGDVTPEYKRERAGEIADDLCNHTKWMTHSRSIHIEDLRGMKLEITDYSQDARLCEAIQRYRAALQLTFEAAGIYKLFETPTQHIGRRDSVPAPTNGGKPQLQKLPADKVLAEVVARCPNCGTESTVTATFAPTTVVAKGHLSWPAGDKLNCPKCGTTIDLAPVRKQIETQFGKPITVAEQ